AGSRSRSWHGRLDGHAPPPARASPVARAFPRPPIEGFPWSSRGPASCLHECKTSARTWALRRKNGDGSLDNHESSCLEKPSLSRSIPRCLDSWSSVSLHEGDWLAWGVTRVGRRVALLFVFC